MKIIVCENYNEMSEQAANIVAECVTAKPNCILGLATGSTPLGLYNNLAELNKNGEIDFSGVTTFNLDEYFPIAQDNNQSYRYFMNKNLFGKINIRIENTFIPNGSAIDPQSECESYEKKIMQYGGIDLQVLGIGQNGHIGFNEPDNFLLANTHIATLEESTITANSRFFENREDVPTKALTMGMATIFKARRIILLASGKEKSNAVASLLNDKISTQSPATMLKLHPDVTLICDTGAYTR